MALTVSHMPPGNGEQAQARIGSYHAFASFRAQAGTDENFALFALYKFFQTL
jgi:hypothetical protein